MDWSSTAETLKNLFGDVVSLGSSLLANGMTDPLRRHLENVEETQQFSYTKLNHTFCEEIGRLDQMAISSVRAHVVLREPYLVLSDSEEIIIFLGVRIGFEQMRNEASGGIQLLRVMVKSPGRFFTAKDLLEQSELSIDPNTLYSYLSRLRIFLRSTESDWPAGFRRGTEYRRAQEGFIRHKQKPRRRYERNADPDGPAYKLDLAPDQVLYVP